MIWAILFLVLSYFLVTSLFGLASAIVNAGFIISFIFFGSIYLLWNFGYWGMMFGLLLFIALMIFIDKTMSK
jgi:hypothetical protein